MTEDEMVGWYHRLNGHEFEQALGDGDGQGSLVCCSPWGHKESDMTEPLDNNRMSEMMSLRGVVSNLFGTRGWLHGTQFLHDRRRERSGFVFFYCSPPVCGPISNRPQTDNRSVA